MNVSVKNAKELLDELVRRAAAGKHLMLTSNGEKIAEIGPISTAEPAELHSDPCRALAL